MQVYEIKVVEKIPAEIKDKKKKNGIVGWEGEQGKFWTRLQKQAVDERNGPPSGYR